MSSRWGPGGSNWIRVLDYGSAAAWVRPEDDGASIAVDLGGYYDEQVADIWVVRVLRGSDLLDTILDKVHRIRYVAEDVRWESFKVVDVEHHQEPVSHRGHPRCNYNRHIWRGRDLPRRVRDAIGFP